jgi:hypothetical protein
MVYFHIFHGILVQNICLKRTIFWDMMPCSLVEDHLHFRGIYCLRLQCRIYATQAPSFLLIPYSVNL